MAKMNLEELFSVVKNYGREVFIFLQNFNTRRILLLEIIIKCRKILTCDQFIVFKSRMLHNMKIYDHVLSPLLMQNPYSKFILAINTLTVDRFSKCLQVLLRQIEI